MTEELSPTKIEQVAFEEDYIDHPFIPSRDPERVEAFLTAFAEAQRNYTPVVRDKLVKIRPRDKPEYSFKYAELSNVIDATKALHDQGIGVSQPLHEDRQGITWLYTIIAHAKGAGRVTRIKLGGAEDIKAFGGIVTYLRRYCFAPAVGVASEDDADENGDGGGRGDDDGAGYGRERAPTPPTTKAAPQRKAPAAAPAAGKDAAAATKPTPGALKNVLGKLTALNLTKEDEAAMLVGLEVPEIPDNWTLADWQKVKAEVERRMAV